MKNQNRIRLGAMALSVMIATAAHAAPDLEKAFKRMDSDGNGSISADEFRVTSVANARQSGEKKGLGGDELAAHVGRAEKSAPQRYKKADTNGDGELSMEEFVAMRAAQDQPGDKGKSADKAKGDKAKDKKKDK